MMIIEIRETTVDNLSARVYGEVKCLKYFKFTANLSIDNFTTNKIVFQTPIAGDAKDVTDVPQKNLKDILYSIPINYCLGFIDLTATM